MAFPQGFLMLIDQTPPLPPRAKEFTVLMALLMSIVAISIDALLPALGIIADELRLTDPNHAQYLLSLIFVGLAVGQLIAGPLSDAWGRKKILYCGIGLYLFGTVICLFADRFAPMLAGRMIQGLGVAGPYVCAVSIVRDKYSGAHMARIMSLIMMIFIIVPAIAPTLGQAILLAASWRGIFVLYLVYALVITALLYFRLEETLPPDQRVPFTPKNLAHGLREVIGSRVTTSYTMCMGMLFGAFIGYLNSSQQIFQIQFHTGKMFTVYFGLLAIVFGAASLVNSLLVERVGMRKLCYLAISGMVGVSAVFLLLHAFMTITLWMFLIYAAVLFFNFGIAFGNFNALAMEPMGHIAGLASAIIGAVSSVISITLGTMIGQMYDGTLVPVTAGFLLLGVVALGLMKRAG